MHLLDSYTNYWTHSFDFRGRTRRIDFWLVTLVTTLLTVVLWIPAIATSSDSSTAGIVPILFALINWLPSLSMQIRRIRDTGRRWFWIFAVLIPFVGAFILLVINCSKSEAR